MLTAVAENLPAGILGGKDDLNDVSLASAGDERVDGPLVLVVHSDG